MAREKSGPEKKPNSRARAAAPRAGAKGRAQPASRPAVKRGVSAKGRPVRGARGKASRKRLPPKRPRIRPAASIAVADLVTVPGEAHNLIGRYDPRAVGLPRGGAQIEGVVCSIREIASGRLVAKTKGPLERYVIELVHDLSFNPQFSSVLTIGGGKAPAEVGKNPMWLRLRSLLRGMAQSNQLVSVASGGLAGASFRQLLDGWRVVKVKAELLTRQE